MPHVDEITMVEIDDAVAAYEFHEQTFGMPLDEVEEVVLEEVCLVVEDVEVVTGLHDVQLLVIEVVDDEVDVLLVITVVWLVEIDVSEYSI